MQRIAQVGGKLGHDIHRIAGDRMGERQAGGVQELALEAERTDPPVLGVAGHREPNRGQVDADLMGSPGVKHDPEQRGAGEELLDLEVRARLTARVGVDRHQQPVTAVATDRRLDRPGARLGSSLDEGEVLASQLSPSELLLERPVDRI